MVVKSNLLPEGELVHVIEERRTELYPIPVLDWS